MARDFSKSVRALLVCFLIIQVRVSAHAESTPIWLPPVRISDGDTAVLVDGQFAMADSVEYVRGRRIPLSNWMGDWDDFSPPDGEVYVQLHSPASPIYPSSLFVGVKIPRFWNQNTGVDSGLLELYFAFNDQNCPQAEDRQIRMNFSQADAPGATLYDVNPTLTFQTNEYKGVPTGNCFDSEPVVIESEMRVRRSELRMDEFGDEKFLFAEFEIVIPSSVFAAEQLKMGVRFVDEDYGSANCPRCCSAVLTLPNDAIAQTGTPDQLDWGREGTYQVFDLKEPELTELGVSVYNVGQMLDFGVLSILQGRPSEIVDLKVENGGVADPEDIADAIWSRDIVCLSEVMMFDDRKEILEHANKIRKNKGLPPFVPVMVDSDNSPNVMILSWWRPIVAAEIHPYSALDPSAPGPDDSVLGSSRGAKGVAWARLGLPPKCKFGPPFTAGGCPENQEVFDPHQWVDVFCTHTQAPCSPSDSSECDSEKDQHLNATRQKQFEALAKYIRKKRATREPFGDGLDRPAILLGDLNQVGPRSLPDNWGTNAKMIEWLVGDQPTANPDIYDGNKSKIALAYKEMRTRLGNWFRTEFDRRSGGEYIGGYDLTANTNGEGTWIGEENKGGTGDKRTDECTPSYPDMKKEARLDYIMLLPPEEKYPSWAFRWHPGKPQHAQVDKHFKSTDDEGCLSDHAEVFAHIQLVPATLPKASNPFRENRLYYSPALLHDVDNEDDTFGDDGTTDWYTNKFFLATRDGSGNELARCQSSWGDDITPDGRTITPGWRYRGHPMKDKHSALVWLEVSDNDYVSNDYYDSHSRSPCKHTEITFKLDKLEVTEEGCGMSLTRPIAQGKGLSWLSKGNGDAEDVQITNVFSLCEINQDPGCNLQCSPP